MNRDLPEPSSLPYKMPPRAKFFHTAGESVWQGPGANTEQLGNGIQSAETPEPMQQVVPTPVLPPSRAWITPATRSTSTRSSLSTPPPLPSLPPRPLPSLPPRPLPSLPPRPLPSLPPPLPDQGFANQAESRDRTRVPGSFGFDKTRYFQAKKEDTFPMAVLRGIAEKQGQPQTDMQSEITGAASGAAIVGFGNIAGTLLKYVGNFIIQRSFGPGLFGLYSLGLSFVTLISSIFNLGLDDAMLRYIPVYRTKKQPGALRSLVVFCTALSGIAGLVGAVLMLIFTPQLVALRHTPQDASLLTLTFELMAPLIPLLCMQGIWFGGLQGFKAFKSRILSQRLVPAVSLIALLAIAVLFFPNLEGVITAMVLSTVFGTVLSLYYLFRLISKQGKQTSKSYEVREWLGFATPNFLTTITDTVMESTDTLLLAFFAISSVGLGQYAAAIKYSNFITIPLISLNTIFAPTIAELHSKGEMKKLEAMFKVVTRWTIILSLPIFCITTLFSASLLALSGKGFIAAWPLLIAFSVGSMFNAGTGCVGYMLLLTGHQKLSFMNSLAGIVVNVVLGVILTPRFGAMGTAISTGLAVIVLNLARLLQVRVLLKIQPYSWEMFKPLVAGLVSVAVSGVLFYLLTLVHIPLIVCLGIVPIFLALYFGLIVLFKIGPEDRIVVDKLRSKLLRGKKNK
ncbi:MAG TPA: flippase [Ktedonobacteraceae bacterium]|nr:flippase [Ktedonobacteraceae bacterium]